MRIILAAAVTVALFGGAASKAHSSSSIRDASLSRTVVERCSDSQKAIGYYRRAYTAHREKMQLTGAVPRVWYACDAARRRAVEWRDRAADARVKLVAWVVYNFDWESWLPNNWKGVARCETHFNWEHSNSSFVSAFGISWREYNADAAYMGAPSWHVRHTPRDQYLAALGHYRRFGDGWGCPGP